jgi:hypothetical protein
MGLSKSPPCAAADDRMRPLLLMWAAAPAAAAMSYAATFGPTDSFYTITHWMGECVGQVGCATGCTGCSAVAAYA